MNKGGIAVLVVAALVFAALGFVFGQVVQAVGNNPGPLVSESWVEKYVGEKMADMQLKIDELEAQLMQNGVGTSGANNSEGIPEPGSNNGSETQPQTPSTPQPTTVKVKSSSVNVRSDATVSASVVGNVSANTTLTYLSQKTDSSNQVWYKVRLSDGTEGWIASWLCFDPE